MNKDYYDILGVSKNAPKDEIKKAYRKLAHKYHPDKDGGNEQKFKELNEAYYILGDEKRRSEYDRYGRVFSGNGAGGGPQGFDFNGFDFSGLSDFSDIFSDLFGFSYGGSESGARKRRGRDISIDLEITFEESVFGVLRKVLLSRTAVCDECKGKGSAPDATFKTCDICSGTGKIRETKKSIFGTFTSQKTCSECRGSGKIASKKCKVCRGEGVLKKSDEISIKIPSGIYDGEMIKMPASGEAVPTGVSGDLYVKIHVRPHQIFRREGDNLIMHLNIPLSEALLGGERKISTLEDQVKVKIPEGVNYGDVLRLKGKGVPHKNGGRGDLLVKIIIKMPKNLSRKSKKLIEELKEEGI
ncbi:MAG: molecular chaperone DnaJ [Candidatus Pacebacteria bacterium]|nr:molecular chaperone DnaJ [Candidatus Paceibacterota bacterium]